MSIPTKLIRGETYTFSFKNTGFRPSIATIMQRLYAHSFLENLKVETSGGFIGIGDDTFDITFKWNGIDGFSFSQVLSDLTGSLATTGLQFVTAKKGTNGFNPDYSNLVIGVAALLAVIILGTALARGYGEGLAKR